MRQILLPPLSNLELCGFPRFEEAPQTPGGEADTRVGDSEAGAGGGAGKQQRGKRLVMVLPVQVNVNLRGSTLEELQERRKKLHLEAFKNIIAELQTEFRAIASPEADLTAKFTEFKQAVIDECRACFDEHDGVNADVFNTDARYKELLVEALQTKVRTPAQMLSAVGLGALVLAMMTMIAEVL